MNERFEGPRSTNSVLQLTSLYTWSRYKDSQDCRLISSSLANSQSGGQNPLTAWGCKQYTFLSFRCCVKSTLRKPILFARGGPQFLFPRKERFTCRLCSVQFEVVSMLSSSSHARSWYKRSFTRYTSALLRQCRTRCPIGPWWVWHLNHWFCSLKLCSQLRTFRFLNWN